MCRTVHNGIFLVLIRRKTRLLLHNRHHTWVTPQMEGSNSTLVILKANNGIAKRSISLRTFVVQLSCLIPSVNPWPSIYDLEPLIGWCHLGYNFVLLDRFRSFGLIFRSYMVGNGTYLGDTLSGTILDSKTSVTMVTKWRHLIGRNLDIRPIYLKISM